jgi:hypothetical protein
MEYTRKIESMDIGTFLALSCRPKLFWVHELAPACDQDHHARQLTAVDDALHSRCQPLEALRRNAGVLGIRFGQRSGAGQAGRGEQGGDANAGHKPHGVSSLLVVMVAGSILAEAGEMISVAILRAARNRLIVSYSNRGDDCNTAFQKGGRENCPQPTFDPISPMLFMPDGFARSGAGTFSRL